MTNNKANNFAVNLANLRRCARLTQQKLADKIGIKRSCIGAYEERRAEPSIDMLIKIAEFFCLSVDAMVKGSYTERRPTPPQPPNDRIVQEGFRPNAPPPAITAKPQVMTGRK